MPHDRLHAREPTHDRDRWSVGVVTGITERDGHCVVTVAPESDPDSTGADADGRRVDLVVTFAVRDLFLDRLDTDGSPVGERVWYRRRGG